MELAYYIHGLKWKVVPTDDEWLKSQTAIPYHILDELYPKDDSFSSCVNVKEIWFEIKDIFQERIPFSCLDIGQYNILIRSAQASSLTGMKFKGTEIKEVNLRDGYFIVGDMIAECNNPHVYVDYNGELAYRNFIPEVEPIKSIKVKKDFFDTLDLD
jgi:hypothetical protein